ncbi:MULTISPECIES: DUF3152 domain-containing protein [unclassified Streptomyces]|uniref:DUF3152 domain-containing protein n=1 Tax=unclassified Streptomyces TaxID=2593676 RepID=UPI00224EC688|nr:MULTISPECIES: DUF3152 domain-containing protein [unclassified Streptomyces]MCX4527435.1 DUF3152 domain-containing protein [Streptomyces sp. NBC_01551]MCX4541984.1 DUF3152 domain-containing protein [Streptomyces sp. NBC_01565]
MPAGHTTGHSSSSTRTSGTGSRARGRSGTRAQRRAAARRKRLRRTVIGSAALVALAGTGYALAPEGTLRTVADGRATGELGEDPRPEGEAPAARGGRRAPGPSPSSGAADSAASPDAEPSGSPSASASASASGSVPASGPGTFGASSVSGKPQGKGTVRRWRIEVEEGSGVDADDAARAVEAILGDTRGWIKDPAYGFQLVGAGQQVDFTVKIATPTTTDRLCEVVTPELKGETNCRAGHTVVVNLKRWKEGSPQFKGPVEEYRALIVNHEVGHEIGREHETCPGPGKPAPAMMQQIKGLLGCTANAWPYDRKGTYLSGPHVL